MRSSDWFEARHVYKDAFRRQTRLILMILEFPFVRMSATRSLVLSTGRQKYVEGYGGANFANILVFV